MHAERAAAEEDDPESPQEQLVTGPDGEKLYISESASLSFLDFLRHSLKQLVGVTPFTDGIPQGLALDPDGDQSGYVNTNLKLSLEQRQSLFENYTIQSSGILQLFSAEEAQSLLNDDLLSPKPSNRREDLAAFDTALAIGAQARVGNPTHGFHYAEWATGLFNRARAVAFEKMLANPSPSLVRLFILLAFYTVGTYRQIPAAIYLGIASKAAVVLGLHRPMSPMVVRQGGDYASRLQIWHSLCILDTLSSSLLGRPCSAPRATRHSLTDLPMNPSQPHFNAVLRAGAILDDVCIALNGPQVIDAPAAEALLARLRSWSQSLPADLRKFTCHDSFAISQSDARLIFGNVHVSSVYYFAVILITRPFLVRHLVSGIRRRAGLPTRTPAEPADATLAQVCMASAIYMGQLCRVLVNMRAHDDHHPLSLFSLFKAWAFGSGLIIGFSMLSDDTRPDLHDAFQGLLMVLDVGSDSNPQSRLYAETLRAFDDTIRLYQRVSSQKLPQAAEPFIEQILVIDPVQSQNAAWDAAMSSSVMMDYTNNMLIGGMNTTGMYDNSTMIHDWANMGIQFLEPFENGYGGFP
ncbi:hypothetical protein MBLNU13_g10922t1 [Cladosporium sp. NU13]